MEMGPEAAANEKVESEWAAAKSGETGIAAEGR
jgi:hypothetical protein